jgi:hypothetical protein
VRRDHPATVARRPVRRHPNYAPRRFLRRFADNPVAGSPAGRESGSHDIV